MNEKEYIMEAPGRYGLDFDSDKNYISSFHHKKYLRKSTLDGKAKLKIPSGTQSNTIFRMRGKGIPYLHGYGTGSENVEVVVEVPKKLSKKQKELLKEFEKESKKKKGFLGKIF